jgi:hypothetical protein
MRTVVSGVLALALMSPAWAATITVHEPDPDGRVFVDVIGKIDDEDFTAFKQKTDQIYPIGAGTPRNR